MAKNILIVGATSAIAQEVGKLYANAANRFYLVGRNASRLAAIADDLTVRSGNKAHYHVCDLNDVKNHAALIADAVEKLGSIDVTLIAHGTLTNQKKSENDIDYAQQELQTNFLSNVSMLTLLANYYEKQKRGCLAVISSVAGDRGRQSNYLYGCAKAGLSSFLQGLRNRLHAANVNVLTIKPGFVDTPMTREFKKGLLWAKSTAVAKTIKNAIESNKQVIYVPGFWRYIMLMIKLIPERVFCKMKL